MEFTFCFKQWKQFVLITNLTHLFNVFISLLYMFRVTQCSSSGESIVQIHHLVYIILCRWPPTQSDIYQMMYWYYWFSWWWALDCSKHVQKWNKHIKKCVKLVIKTNCTEMHGQQNIKWKQCPSYHGQDILTQQGNYAEQKFSRGILNLQISWNTEFRIDSGNIYVGI